MIMPLWLRTLARIFGLRVDNYGTRRQPDPETSLDQFTSTLNSFETRRLCPCNMGNAEKRPRRLNHPS